MSALRETVLRELRSIHERTGALLKMLEGEQVKRDAQPGPHESETRPFTGKVIVARYGGRCAVCSEPYNADQRIVYSSVERKSAHVGCGQPDGGSR